MNYMLISPLEHIAVAKIATTLWNQKEIKNLIEDFLSSTCFNRASLIILLHPESNEEWLKVEDNVRNKVNQFPLPNLLKQKVLNAIKPVGSLILKWLSCYFKAFSDIDLPKEFCWTSQGILNERETAKLLTKDKNINIARRYKISCIFCLEDSIKELWNELPEDSKKSICSEINTFNRNKLVSFWTDFINGCDLNSDYLLACKDACQSGNRVAAEYFFKKLHLLDRSNMLHSLAKEVASTYADDSYDITLCLLTHVSKEQQIEFFQLCPSAHLVQLLNWPWQSFFTKTLNYLRSYLPEDHFDNNFYDCLLIKIVLKIMYGYKDFEYQNLLEKYWQQSSDQCKIYFFSSFRISCLLSKLFAMKDMDNIKMILHDATISVKVLRFRRYICEDMIKNEDWDSLKFFIQECNSSELEMLKFKADMKKYMAELITEDTLQRKIDKWNNFFSLLEEIEHESSKRKFIEDDDNGDTKRFAAEK